ncbi:MULTISPECIES: mandelate racemase/muconate lactonizing enzyme family protein [Halomonadaceae]|uniref:D-galactarolactone cycloisomerase n=1 Tax=Vreelandella titanicae TaxID=664683 RepID=A0AAP9T1P3_9GAMM|nr:MULTISPECIES: mandelate racemase/muconate lactonizing enzyme family protein [Halomonas]QKS25625.1 D-galactarolactone cycloisomerase [Halomonas titanicae]CDG53178.1 Mandelate racemase/muconate lactonizing protein [Halomonas sp. A3H3]
MKICSLDTFIVDIPFFDGGKGIGITPTRWNSLETVLIRLEDEAGNVGWGEAFGYFTADAVKAVIDRLISPLIVGATIENIVSYNQVLQQRLHLFGRYGITLFAISGIDIALWDLKARREQVPLHQLFGNQTRSQVPVYASLVRYADGPLAAEICQKALANGFTDLKLHEITLEEIRACRVVVGDSTPMAVDVNCSWSEAETHSRLAELKELSIAWLEEPIFPPEDYAKLAEFRGSGVALACGENWCTSMQFSAAIERGAVDYVQPSVTKVGGISEWLSIARKAEDANVALMPHTPYFGPGLFASLHLAAAFPQAIQLEYLFVEPRAWLFDVEGHRQNNQFLLPEGPGLGVTPDHEVLTRYRRA